LEYKQQRSQLGWVLAAGDYAAAQSLAAEHDCAAILILGPDASTIPTETLRALVDSIRSGVDLALPRYPLAAHEGLISSALLYPLTRSLFSCDIRFPLPADAALSPRMLARLATVAGRLGNTQAGEALVWPVAEASVAGFKVEQCNTAARLLAGPAELDLNALLASVAGSLFADIETKAAFWQRGRSATPASTYNAASSQNPTNSAPVTEDIRGMIDGFRLASANLTEIWSLVLPPQTLLALKKLSRVPHEDFVLDPALWARIVYDFVLAFHLRSLNRGHLLGAMTPLYLAWVASQIRSAGDDAGRAARLTEATALAFEQEKPYLVSRWRWPDRFNP
jgi:hypothetical protein